MKQLLVLLMLLTTLVFGANAAFALPTLQLDIAGGTYNTEDETIYATSNPFTLYALGMQGDKGISFNPSDTFYLSIAVTPKTSVASDYGYFTINGKKVNVTADMVYGTPPVDTTEPVTDNDVLKDMGSHGIYDTFYLEYAFKFDSSKQAVAYNSQDYRGGVTSSSNTGFYYQDFLIDTTALKGVGLHFDLYHKNAKGVIDEFAPFSHDAQSGIPGNPVPEPGTIFLLGAGLFGVLGFGKKFKK